MPSLADEILEDSERRRRERRERFESSMSPVYAPEPIAPIEHDPYGYIEDPVKREAFKNTLATGKYKSVEQLAVEHPDWYQRGLTAAGNVDVSGMEARDRQNIIGQYARASDPASHRMFGLEGVPVVGSVLQGIGNLPAGLAESGAGILGSLGVPGATDVSRGFTDMKAEHEAYKSMLDDANTYFPAAVEKLVRGGTESIANAVFTGQVGGFPTIVGNAMLNTYYSTRNEDLDSGLNEEEARVHATTAAVIEGGVTSAFQAAGLGGAEKGVLDALRGTFKIGSKELLKRVGFEAAEEAIITGLSDLNDKLQGTDPNKTPMDFVKSQAWTFAQTLFTMGMMEGGMAGVRKLGGLGQQSEQAAVQPDPTTRPPPDGPPLHETGWRQDSVELYEGLPDDAKRRLAELEGPSRTKFGEAVGVERHKTPVNEIQSEVIQLSKIWAADNLLTEPTGTEAEQTRNRSGTVPAPEQIQPAQTATPDVIPPPRVGETASAGLRELNPYTPTVDEFGAPPTNRPPQTAAEPLQPPPPQRTAVEPTPAAPTQPVQRAEAERLPFASPVRENGAKTSLILKDGTAIVGGQNHGQTFGEALKRSVASEDDLANATPGFTRPDGTSWDIHGKKIPTTNIVSLDKAEAEQPATIEVPADPEAVARQPGQAELREKLLDMPPAIQPVEKPLVGRKSPLPPSYEKAVISTSQEKEIDTNLLRGTVVDEYTLAKEEWDRTAPLRELRGKLQSRLKQDSTKGIDENAIPNADTWFRTFAKENKALGLDDPDESKITAKVWNAAKNYNLVNPDTKAGREQIVETAAARAASESSRTVPVAASGDADDDFLPDNVEVEVEPGVVFSSAPEAASPAKPKIPRKPQPKTQDALEARVTPGKILAPYTEQARSEADAKGVPQTSKLDVVRSLGTMIDKITGLPMTVRTGMANTKPKKTRGEFSMFQKRIRTRGWVEFDVNMHEAGHDEFEYSPELKDFWKNRNSTPAELAELWDGSFAMYPKAPKVTGRSEENVRTHEGFAEFKRLWLSDQAEAVKIFPKFTAWYEAKMQERPAAWKAMKEAQATATNWRTQSSASRARGGIEDPYSLKNKTEEAKQVAKDTLTRSMLEDAAAPIFKLARAVQERIGKAFAPSKNPELLVKGQRMTANAKVEGWVEREMTNHRGEKIGDSLREIVSRIKAPMNQETSDRLDSIRWALMTKAEDDAGGREPTGLSIADAEQVLKEPWATPDMLQAAEEVSRWLWQAADYAAESDPAFQAQLDGMRTPRPDVADPTKRIPLQRYFAPDYDSLDRAMQERRKSGPSSAAMATISKGRKGSTRVILPPMQQTINEAHRMVQLAQKRSVLRSIVDIWKMTQGKNPIQIPELGPLIEYIPPSRKLEYQTTVERALTEVNKALDEAGEPPVDISGIDDAVGGLGVQFFETGYTDKQGREHFAYNDNGKIRYFAIQKDLRQAMEGMNPLELNGVARVLSIPTQWVKKGAVALNPGFQVGKNPLIDLPTLLQALETVHDLGDIARVTGMYVKNVTGALVYNLTGKASPGLRQFLSAGGSGSTILGDKSPGARQMTQRLFSGPGIGKAFDALVNIMQSGELGGRLTAFEDTMRSRGVDLKKDTPTEDDMLVAMTAAHEALGDHAGKGHAFRFIDQFAPFASTPITYGRTAIQGVARNPKKAAGFLMAGAAASLAYFMQVKDEEWWKEANGQEKWRNLRFNIGGTLFKYPLDSHVLMMAVSLPLAIYDSLDRMDPKSFGEWSKEAFRQLAPLGGQIWQVPESYGASILGANPIAQVAIEGWSGRQLYNNRPTVPADKQGLVPSQQFTERTSLLARKLGEVSEQLLGKDRAISPMKADRVVSSLTGGASEGLSDAARWAAKKIAGKETEWADVPVIGSRFARRGLVGTSPDSTEKFYDLSKSMEMKDPRVQERIAAEKNPVEKERLQEEADEAHEMTLMFGDASKAMTKLRKRRELPDTAPAEKEQLQNRINEIAQAALKAHDADKIDRPKFKTILRVETYNSETDETDRDDLFYNRIEPFVVGDLRKSGNLRTDAKRLAKRKADQKAGRDFIEALGLTNKEVREIGKRAMIANAQAR